MDDRVPEQRNSQASSSHESSSEPRLREVRIWVNTVFILTFLKTEIARSVRGPKSQGSRAEGPLAELNIVQKFLVI